MNEKTNAHITKTRNTPVRNQFTHICTHNNLDWKPYPCIVSTPTSDNAIY